MEKIVRRFHAGDEIVYIPMHANGDPHHPDSEWGIVERVYSKTNTVFCRFFYPDGRLRTVANSEGCDPRDLIFQSEVKG